MYVVPDPVVLPVCLPGCTVAQVSRGWCGLGAAALVTPVVSGNCRSTPNRGECTSPRQLFISDSTESPTARAVNSSFTALGGGSSQSGCGRSLTLLLDWSRGTQGALVILGIGVEFERPVKGVAPGSEDTVYCPNCQRKQLLTLAAESVAVDSESVRSREVASSCVILLRHPTFPLHRQPGSEPGGPLSHLILCEGTHFSKVLRFGTIGFRISFRSDSVHPIFSGFLAAISCLRRKDDTENLFDIFVATGEVLLVPNSIGADCTCDHLA